jgi:ABC-type antimicrobial peptide transport system permease subunit
MWISAAIALTLTLVSGLVPALRASRMSVVAALRTVE